MRAALRRGGTATLTLLAFAASLAPALWYLSRGALRTSLWLDEVVYYYWETASWTTRALEVNRPGLRPAAYVGHYTYGFLERVVHAAFDHLGFPIAHGPELYVRATSLASFALLAALVLAALRRRGQPLWMAAVGTLCVTGLVIVVCYAFEGRVYMLASLLCAAYLLLVRRALDGEGRRGLLAAALVGVVAQRFHFWAVCLPAGLLLAGIVRALIRRVGSSP